ncbi:hypothetical protein Q7P36_008189 [Cladosporium allicinum]
MSQGTPTRDSRIERHLMRQRGAGVRTITADFGFSFALPTTAPAFPEQPIVEHPTKRQRTVDSPSSKPCKIHTANRVEEGAHSPKGKAGKKEDILAKVEELPAQEVPQEVKTIEAPTLVRSVGNPKGSKVPSKTRRKLRLDDELETLPKPKKKAPQSEGLEDTFIFGLKPKKRQPKNKPKETIEEEPTHEEIDSAPAPPKKKRTAKAKQQTIDESCEKAAEEANGELIPLEAKSQKDKGKHKSQKRTNALPTDIESSEKASPPTTTEEDPVKKKLLESHHVETKQSQTAPKATKPKATAKKAAKRTIEDVVENEPDTVPEPTAKRPRRQAAISATVKVAQGYEEELVPADKLRRAPELAAKRGRPKKITAPECVPVLPPSPPPSTLKPLAEEAQDCGEDEVPVAKVRSVGRPRKLGAKIAKVDTAATENEPVANSPRPGVKTSAPENSYQVAETETSVQKEQSVKRARKVRTPVVAQDVCTDNEPAKEMREIEQKQSRASKEPLLKASRKAASKTVKPVDIVDEEVAVDKEVSGSPEIVIPGTQESHETNAGPDALAVDQATRSRSDKKGEPKTKSRRVLAESDVNIVRSLPPDDSVKPATAKRHQVDEVMTKPASKDIDMERFRKNPSSRKTKLVPDVNLTVEHKDANHFMDPMPVASVDITHSKRARKAQPTQPSKSTPIIETPLKESATPKQRHVIAADEDLDWLFEKSENKRSRLPARNPRASSKGNRQAPVKSADAKDMDLDDLLESIAGFSGKLLTGKSGRAMASR